MNPEQTLRICENLPLGLRWERIGNPVERYMMRIYHGRGPDGVHLHNYVRLSQVLSLAEHASEALPLYARQLIAIRELCQDAYSDPDLGLAWLANKVLQIMDGE